MKRCSWVKHGKIEEDYHDKEWGVPVYDDRLLFEFLVLEGAQAGLSWITILKKRARYREVFDNFDVQKILRYDERKIEALLNDSGIIRNKRKILSVLTNAKAFVEVQREYGSFARYIWSFTDGKPIQNRWKRQEEIPAKTEISEAMSKALKQRGFSFVGPTICYSFMQAVGMVNDHTTDCFRHGEILKDKRTKDWIECR